jgi:hypothetical protein
VTCPRCRGYVFVTEDGWGTALRCLHCGWEKDVAARTEMTAGGATSQAADGRAPPLWEAYCAAFPWEDWVRLALFCGTCKRGMYGKGRFRLHWPGRKRG